MPMTDAQAALIINTARGVAMAAWTSRVALYTGDPRAGGLEVSGGSYARQLVTFDAAVGRLALNNNTVLFPTPSATWGELMYAALVDAVTGGTVRQVYLLAGTSEQRTVGVGSTPPSFAPGTITLGFDLGAG